MQKIIFHNTYMYNLAFDPVYSILKKIQTNFNYFYPNDISIRVVKICMKNKKYIVHWNVPKIMKRYIILTILTKFQLPTITGTGCYTVIYVDSPHTNLQKILSTILMIYTSNDSLWKINRPIFRNFSKKMCLETNN